jgi:hypothetical protein
MSAAEQLELPFDELRDVLVVVVAYGRKKRPRVKPVDFDGWVKIRKDIRKIGARYIIPILRPRKGGAWTAIGEPRPVP